jgi:hypothetical protein
MTDDTPNTIVPYSVLLAARAQREGAPPAEIVGSTDEEAQPPPAKTTVSRRVFRADRSAAHRDEVNVSCLVVLTQALHARQTLSRLQFYQLLSVLGRLVEPRYAPDSGDIARLASQIANTGFPTSSDPF